jgi:hypothetical protein
MYVSERPFQFSDLAKAVQRSAGLSGRRGGLRGLGQDVASYYEEEVGSGAMDYETPYPIVVSPDESALAAANPSTVVVGSTTTTSSIPWGTVGIVAALLLGGAFLFGARR